VIEIGERQKGLKRPTPIGGVKVKNEKRREANNNNNKE
jgi:hypothetical protein